MIYILRRKGYGRELTKLLAEKLGAFSTASIRKIKKEDTVIRWGNPEYRGDDNAVILNKFPAVSLATNKRRARLEFKAAGVNIPPTGEDVKTRDFPKIIRPVHHFGAQDFFYCEDLTQELKAMRALRDREIYVSRYIKKDREFRVFVIQGRVVCVAEKIVEDKNQIAWNNALGSHFETLGRRSWPISVVSEAIKANNCLGLDFGAVDVISKNTDAYVLEINTAFNLESEYRTECVAKGLKWACEGKPVPPAGPNGKWRDYVHPAVSDKARE